MPSMNILIVDDERPARDKLRRLLTLEPDVASVDEARDGAEALQKIAGHRPDALFLDIQMPCVSGIELAASLPAPAPPLVFVTAFDQYALRAFDANAADYLLKPFDRARLQRALGRLRERLALPAHGTVPVFGGAGLPLRQLLVSERGVTKVVPVEQIQWLESADNYVILHTAQGQPLMRQTLAGLVDKLGHGFVRCHRRAAVQTSWIDSIAARDKGDCELLLRGGARVPCSRQYRDDVMTKLR